MKHTITLVALVVSQLLIAQETIETKMWSKVQVDTSFGDTIPQTPTDCRYTFHFPENDSTDLSILHDCRMNKLVIHGVTGKGQFNEETNTKTFVSKASGWWEIDYTKKEIRYIIPSLIDDTINITTYYIIQ